jgi:ADP-ribose pyrophosphatase YjhB (NUDIX family)
VKEVAAVFRKSLGNYSVMMKWRTFDCFFSCRNLYFVAVATQNRYYFPNFYKDHMSYNNPVPAALAVVRVRRTDGSLALLGIVRKLTPAGGTAFPGGYVDELETARGAAARELWEETRLVTNASQWRLLDDRISAQNRLLIFCEFMFEIPEELLANFVPTKEASAVLCLTLDSEICFPNHAAVARAYLAQTSINAYPEVRPELDMSSEL